MNKLLYFLSNVFYDKPDGIAIIRPVFDLNFLCVSLRCMQVTQICCVAFVLVELKRIR